MSRLQAVLLIVVILAALMFHQNVRWPEHLWDTPAFRTFRFEELSELPKFLSSEDKTEKKNGEEPARTNQ